MITAYLLVATDYTKSTFLMKLGVYNRCSGCLDRR